MKKFLTMLLVCLTLNVSAQFTANVPTEKDSIINLRKPIPEKNKRFIMEDYRNGEIIAVFVILSIIIAVTMNQATKHS